MSVYNYNQFNTPGNIPYTADPAAPSSPPSYATNVYNKDFVTQNAELDRINKETLVRNSITPLQDRARERVELNPVKAIESRGFELRRLSDQGIPINGVAEIKSLIDEYYAPKLLSSANTISTLWAQTNNSLALNTQLANNTQWIQRVGKVNPEELLNPAVVEQIRASIKQGKDVSPFLPGGRFSNKVRDDLKVFTPEMAAAVEKLELQEGTYATQQSLARYYSRPGLKEYTDLFSSGDAPVQGVFFQFQNSTLISNLMRKGTSFNVLTQALDEKAFTEKDNNRLSILVGNELSIGVSKSGSGKLPANTNVYGIESSDSFHPKLGYIPSKTADGFVFQLAFITTQNITNALSSNKSVENLLVLNSGSNNYTERTAAQEIVNYTDYLLRTASGKKTSTEVMKASDLQFSSLGPRKYLKLQGNNLTEIKDTYANILETAAKSLSDKVIVSMEYLTATGLDTLGSLQNLETLARENRLVVSLSADKIESARKEDSATYNIYKTLANYGALRIVPMTKVHEKSITVLDKNNRVIAYTSGSANISRNALSGINNIETNIYIGSGNYNFTTEKNDLQNKEYLSLIQGVDSGGNLIDSEFNRHMALLSGGKWGGFSPVDQSQKSPSPDIYQYLYLSGYKTEMPYSLVEEEKLRINNIKKLEQEILRLNASNKTKIGSIDISYRYAPEARHNIKVSGSDINSLEPVGLRVNIKSPEGRHNVSLDLTVTSEGNVVISDLNKIIGRSIWVNKTSNDQVIFEGGNGLIQERIVKSGESTILNPYETTLSYINTIQREFVYQSSYAQKDVYFQRLYLESFRGAISISQDFLAEQFRKVNHKLATMKGSDSSLRPTNFSTIIKELSKLDDTSRTELIDKAFHRLAQDKQALASMSLMELQPDMRLIMLSEIKEQMTDQVKRNMSDEEIYRASNTIGTEFLSLLIQDMDESKLFADVRSEFINKDERLRKEYNAMTRTQSRAIVGELSSAFVATHESTYDAYQAKSRMPIYGESVNFSNTYHSEVIADFFRQGMLNPLAYGHATRLGPPGTLYRSLGSSATGESLKLPHLGGLRQLSIVDSDLSTGAGVAHDYDTLSGSVSNLRKITKQEYLEELRQIGVSVDTEYIDKLFSVEGSEEEVALMYSSFTKAERLTQRIKNIVGSRAAYEFNKKYIAQALSSVIDDETFLRKYNLDKVETTGRVDDSPKNVLAGQLRRAVSSEQLKRIKQVKNLLARSYGITEDQVTIEQVEDYFKEQLFRPENLEHGFIGPSEIRRVAVHTGVNLLSDPIYANAGFDTLYGNARTFKAAKLNLSNVEDPMGIQVKMLDLFSRQGIITTESWKVGDDVYQPGYYIKDDNNEVKQVAKYTDDGYLEFNDLYKIKQTAFGKQREKLIFKSPAFAHRATGGITIIRGVASDTPTSRGINAIEFEGITFEFANTSARLAAGDGLIKGPLSFLEEDWFSEMDRILQEEIFTDKNGQDTLNRLLNTQGQVNYNQQTFLLTSSKNMKGFSIKGGVSMIASDINPSNLTNNSFVGLYEQDALKVAQSLALMFLGDTEIAQALANTVSDPVKQMGLLNTYGKLDLATVATKSKTKFKQGDSQIDNLLLAASGFLGLASNTDPSNLSLESLKADVLNVLRTGGSTTEAQALRSRAQNLLLSARNSHNSSLGSGVAYGGYYQLDETGGRTVLTALPEGSTTSSPNIIRQQVQLDDHNGTVRAAAIFAQLSLVSTQLFADKHVAQVVKDNKFTINEAPLNNLALYHGFEVLKSDTGAITIKKHKSVENLASQSYANTIDMILGAFGQSLNPLVGEYITKKGNRYKIIPGKEEELYAAYQANQFLLNSYERTYGRGLPIYTLMDVSMSQSLVPAGMKDSVQFEYSSYLALTGRRLAAFREPLGLDDSNYATNVQHAHFAMIGLLNKNMFSTSTDEAIRRASFKLPFTSNTPSTATYGNNTSYNAFNSTLEIDLLSLAKIIPKGEANTALVRKALQNAITLYSNRDSLGSNSISSITDYITKLAIYEGNIDQSLLTYKNGNAIDLTGIDLLINKATSRTKRSENVADYISGLMTVEAAIVAEINNLTKKNDTNSDTYNLLKQLRRGIHNSKNIILPELTYIADDSGNYRAFLRPFSDQSSGGLGMILGTDIFSKVSMIFGDFKSEIANTQSNIIDQLIIAQPVLQKLMTANSNNGVFLDQAEITIYNDLVAASNNTYATIASILQSNVTRQAHGDHESFKGSVGIPINTFLLNPWEMVVGDRVLRLAGESQNISGGGGLAMPALGKLIDRYTYLASEQRASDSRHSSIANIINTYTVRLKNKKELHSVTADQVKEFTKFDPTVGLDQLNTVYNQLRTELGFTNSSATYNRTKAITTKEYKLLLSAQLYSQILDLGDNTYMKVLKELVGDSLDYERLKAQDKLPASWGELIESNLLTSFNPKYTTARLAQLSYGVISQRTGHPGGASAAINEQDNYILMTADIMRNRRIALGEAAPEEDSSYYTGTAQFVPALHRMSTGMIVPSISRFLSMLGDYDGDSHRVIVSKTDKLLTELAQTQDKIDTYDSYLQNFKALDYKELKTKERLIKRKQGQILLDEIYSYIQDDDFIQLIRERNNLITEYKHLKRKIKPIKQKLNYKQAIKNIATLKNLRITDITDSSQIIGAFTKVYENLVQILDHPLTEPTNDPRAPFKPLLSSDTVERLEDFRAKAELIQNSSHIYFANEYLPAAQIPYLDRMESLFANKKDKLLNNIPDSILWQDDMFVYDEESNYRYEEEYNLIKDLTLDSINTEAYLKKNKLDGLNLSYSQQLEIVLEHKKQSLLSAHYKSMPDPKYTLQLGEVYDSQELLKYEQELDRIRNLTVDDMHSMDDLPTFRKDFYFKAKIEQIKVNYRPRINSISNEITLLEQQKHDINTSYNNIINNYSHHSTHSDQYKYLKLEYEEQVFAVEQKILNLRSELSTLKQERETDIENVRNESSNVALGRKSNLLKQISQVISPEILKAELDFADRSSAIKQEISIIRELQTELKESLKINTNTLSSRLVKLLNEKGLIPFDDNNSFDSESFRKILASQPDTLAHYLVNYATRLAYSSAGNSSEDLDNFYNLLETSLNAKLPLEIRIKSFPQPLSDFYWDEASSTLYPSFTGKDDKSNYIKTLKEFIDTNLHNIDVSETYASVDRLTKFNKLTPLVDLLNTTINNDLDFGLESAIGPDGKPFELDIINQHLSLIKTITGVGNAIASPNLRKASQGYTIPPNPSLAVIMFPDMQLSNTNLYTGENTSDNFSKLYATLLGLTSPEEHTNLAMYQKHIDNIKKIESSNPFNIVDYLFQYRDNSYLFNQITDFDNAGKYELNLQIGLFQQQKETFDLEMKNVDSLSDAYKDKYLAYLDIERNRLLEQQEVVINNFTKYLQSVNETPNASLDDILDSLINATESYAPILVRMLEEKIAASRADEDNLMSQLIELQKSRKVLESRNTDDIHKFIKMYTNVPDFIYDGDNQDISPLNLGQAFSLIAQKFSLDGVNDYSEDNRFQVFQARSGIFLDLLDSYNTSDTLLKSLPTLDLASEETALIIKELYSHVSNRLNNLNTSTVNPYLLNKDSLSTAAFSEVTPLHSEHYLNAEEYGFGLELINMTKYLQVTGYEYQQGISSYYGMVANFNVATGDFLADNLKKASGETLNPFHFDAAIQALGKGGSELIGTAYNTLIPLLNQTMLLAPFAVGSTGQEQFFASYIKDLKSRIKKTTNADEKSVLKQDLDNIRQVASKLGVNLGGKQKITNSKQNLEKRFYNTVSVVASFQQIVRDALKPPGKGIDIVDLFGKKVFDLPIITEAGEETTKIASLADILAWADPQFSTSEQDKLRNQTLSQFLGLLLGTNLTNTKAGDSLNHITNQASNPKAQAWLRSIEGQDWVQNLTGFGALMLLSDFSKTEEGKFFDKFISAENSMYGYTAQDFEDWIAKDKNIALDTLTAVDKEGFAREYVKARIVDLMQRTQAGFAAESIKSASVNNITEIMNRALFAYDNMTGDNSPIKDYSNVLEAYKQAKIDNNYDNLSRSDQQKIDYEYTRELLFKKIQLDHASTGAFNADSIEYLRAVQQDLAYVSKTINEKGYIEPSDLSLLHSNNITAYQEMMRRGKSQSMSEALTYGQFNLGMLRDILLKNEFNELETGTGNSLAEKASQSNLQLDPKQMTAGMMLVGLTKQLGLSPQEAKAFVSMLLSNTVNSQGKEVMGLDRLAEDASFLSMISGIANETTTSQADPSENWANTSAGLNQAMMDFVFGDDYTGTVLPTHKIGDLVGDATNYLDQREILNQKYKEATNAINTNEVNIRRTRSLNANYAAEGIGILGSPLLFALAGTTNLELNERVTSFALDIVQGYAELSSNTSSTLSNYLNPDSTSRSAGSFVKARLRQALSVEGIAQGAIQGFGQELMYRSISGVTTQAVGSIFNTSIQRNPNVVNVGSSIAGELIGSVLAQGITRALYQTRGSVNSQPADSPITRLIANYVNEIWKAAEDAQLEQLEAEYVVLDTDENRLLDFDMDSSLSDFQLNTLTGILVLDDSGKVTESNFEESNNDLITTTVR